MHLQACDPGFPIRGMTDEGTFWGKMAGNYMKIKNQRFWGNIVEGHYWTWNFRKVNSFDSLNNKKQLDKMWQ